MKVVNLSVNGETASVACPPRTQLAELLRDELHLTGTHLGCEQGVCGACTVLIDGVPVRSCITYAHSVDETEITTVEGLREDHLGQLLREAFTHHHGLQCGFCTPGMLITARDLLTRYDSLDEHRVREELAGNLCRCTGYVGIVNAVLDVAQQLGKLAGHRVPQAEASRGVFAAFELDEPNEAPGLAETQTALSTADGWSIVERDLPLEITSEAAQEILTNLAAAASCVPGVEVTRVEGDEFDVTASIRFGPIRAQFTGSGVRRGDDPGTQAHLEGSAASSNGQTRVDLRLQYALRATEVDAGTRSSLTLSIQFKLRGQLAQYNRADLVESFSDVLLRQFVRNIEALARDGEIKNSGDASGLAITFAALKNWFGAKR